MTASNRQATFDKYEHLKLILRSMPRVLVAFSGGVDSTFLLKAAVDELGGGVLAVTALSETTPEGEKRAAGTLAADLKAAHMFIDTHELKIPEFTKNGPDKCYICKKYRFGRLAAIAGERGYPILLDGENADDEADYRPGSRAARELGVRSPLREANLTKTDIRTLSKRLGLPTWDKPALACLASRIPYGDPITKQKLRQVDAAESFLHNLGFSSTLRVRHGGETARIELSGDEIPLITENDKRHRVVECFRRLGFQWVTLDMEGYRMGSLNRGLPELQKDGIHG